MEKTIEIFTDKIEVTDYVAPKVQKVKEAKPDNSKEEGTCDNVCFGLIRGGKANA